MKFKRALRLQFWLNLQKFIFAAFLHRSFEVIQIWLTHQSKTLIFFFGMKSFFNLIFGNLWKTGKVNFTSSNLVCVFTHILNFKIWNLVCLFSTKFLKIRLHNFSYEKIENQSFRLMGWSYVCHFLLSVWESGKSFFL